MVYEWQNHEQTLYGLYVDQNMSLDEVMQVMKEKYDFDPSKRAYQQQFKRWSFPTKHHPAHDNAELVERIRQLWEKNTSQKEMLRVLKGDGYEISDRGMMRVRAKNRWLLRVPNGVKSYGVKKRKLDHEDIPQDPPQAGEAGQDPGHMSSLEDVIAHHEHQAMPEDDQEDLQDPYRQGTLPPELEQKRKERLKRMQSRSDELYASKRRRRRTRGWAGLPADPPAPPRFPSETTLDESKAFLHMDNERYRQVRDHFQTICGEAGFVKKTEAGPERWQAAKNKLIAEDPHVFKQFNGPFDGVMKESKALALDVVCTDVTKRMRTLDKRVTVAEAKNILGLNPEQSREVRKQFYDILISVQFTGKLEAGEEQWKELQHRWITTSQTLQNVLAAGDADPQSGDKEKAISVLSRDVMKRLRDDQNRSNPQGKKQLNNGPGPGPAAPRFANLPDDDADHGEVQSPKAYRPSPSVPKTPTRKRGAAQAGARSQTQASQQTVREETDNGQIDPSLLAAADDDPSLADQLQQYAASAASPSAIRQHENPYAPATQSLPYSQAHNTSEPQVQQPSTPPTPVWFRNADTSSLSFPGGPGQPWIAMLNGISMYSIRQTAVKGLQGSHGDARVEKVWGIVIDPVSEGENAMLLRSDSDVNGYVGWVRDADGGNPVFCVEVHRVV